MSYASPPRVASRLYNMVVPKNNQRISRVRAYYTS